MHMRYRLWKAYYQVSSPLVAAPCAAIKSDLFGAGNLSLTTFSESIKVCVFVRARVTSFSWSEKSWKQNLKIKLTWKLSKPKNLADPTFLKPCRKSPFLHLRRVFTSPNDLPWSLRIKELKQELEELEKLKDKDSQPAENPTAGWWFQSFFKISPLFGEMIPILTDIFQRGWNHQLDKDVIFFTPGKK